MNDFTHDPRRDPRHDPRHDPNPRHDMNSDQHPDAGRDPRALDPRALDPRVQDTRVQDSRVQDPGASDPRRQSPRSPDPFASEQRPYRSPNPNESYEPQRRQPTPAVNAEPRSPLAYPQEPRMQDPRMQEPRMQDPRMHDPRMHDPRLNDLGQRLQRFGSAPQAQSRPVSEAASTYPGAPLPVGPSSANYAAGEFDRPIPRDFAQPEPVAAPRPQEFASQSYGIPPTAPNPVAASASQPSYPFMSQPNPPAVSPVPAATPAASSSATPPAQEQPLLAASTDDSAAKGGFQRIAQAVRAAIPFVQKLLPLLDGNLATTVSALIATQPSAHPPVQQVHVDLEPVERGMTELRTSHRELRTQVAEQGTTLKRVEDQLERVREATDRNTLEQQELVEDVRSVGTRVSRFVVIGILLLAISVGLNVYLLIQLQHIFR